VATGSIVFEVDSGSSESPLVVWESVDGSIKTLATTGMLNFGRAIISSDSFFNVGVAASGRLGTAMFSGVAGDSLDRQVGFCCRDQVQ